MTVPLLTTKLYLPSPRPKLVPRTRLLARLDEALHLGHKLTLISAHAGFGKTTLLSEWIAGYEPGTANFRCAWLSLDAGDNDPVRFWTYFIAALQTVQVNVGKTALTLLQSPGFAEVNTSPQNELMLTALVNEIVNIPDRLVLVLDDYHVIKHPAIDESLAFLLDHLPPQLHLIITTRADPLLPLSRLRARGELTELRAADLRFTRTEVEVFLNQVMELELSTQATLALGERTEGWITGLQLAALSMRGQDPASRSRFVTAFTGSHRYILDYLTEEVIQRQPAEVQSFLMETAILERLSGPLCDAVTGRDDSQAVLEALELANLFIISLDDERRWYRYHHLFADFVRTYLQKSVPKARLMELHQRAGQWFARHDLFAEAIKHALVAEDFEKAAKWIEQLAPSIHRAWESVCFQCWNSERARPTLPHPWHLDAHLSQINQ